jgi:recombination protein RecT
MATAVAEKTVNPMETLRHQLDKRKDELTRALPTHIPAERFIRVVQTAVQINPDLLTCNRQSLWNSCLRAAQDGLLPDGREGAIVPFRDNSNNSPTKGQTIATWMPMTYGLLKRFRNSGQFKSITTNIVRDGDEFQYWVDENGEHMRHEPQNDTGKAIKVYAAAVLKGGGTMIKVMTHADVEKRRAVSKAKDGPMWREWWDEAAMKTVLRNLAKRLPTSSDLDDLIRRDDALYSFDTAATGGATPAVRAPNVAGALDQFSGADTPQPSSTPDQTSDTDEPGNTSNPDGDSGDEESRAHEAGAKAHRAGMARKAVPPEYRTPENSHLAKAWLTGWDSAE